MRLPDPLTSRAILIGSALYEDSDIPDLPAVTTNVSDLAEILVNPELGGLDAASCHSFVDLRSDQVWRIADLAGQAEDVLLVYFAGHGLLSDDGRLLLGLANTKYSYPEFTALHVDQLARAIETSQAKTRLFVIDCCYSERALRHMGTPAQQLVIEGTYTLASAPANRTAVAPVGERHTAFTGELISLLRAGDPGEDELLSVNAVFRKLVSVLRAKGYPTPKQSNSGTAATLALVRNVAFRPTTSSQQQPLAVDLRRAVLRVTASAAERLESLDALIQLAWSDQACVEELELLAVSGYLPVLVRLGCVCALDMLGEKSRAVAAAATIVQTVKVGYETLDQVRALLGPLVGSADKVVLATLGEGPHKGSEVANMLADFAVPAPERIRAAQDLAAFGCHQLALAMLHTVRIQLDVPNTLYAEIEQAVRQIKAHEVAEIASGKRTVFTYRWPIQPLLGEPPLTLFKDKQLIVLTPGMRIDRFGEPTGNVTYKLATPFDQRSIPPKWINRAYHAYRTVERIQALTGTAIPGGGTAYVLEASVAELLERGALVQTFRE